MTVFRPVCQKYSRVAGKKDGGVRDRGTVQNEHKVCKFHHKKALNPTSSNFKDVV